MKSKGADIPDVECVIQFGVPLTMSMWLQGAGRAGRNPSIQAEAIMLIEKSVFEMRKKKSKKDDPTDYSLGRHLGFFNDASKLHGYNHAADARDNPEKVVSGRFTRTLDAFTSQRLSQVETCSGFKVTRSQKPGKFRYLDVTGVVAVTCIRHGCVQCQGLVDMLAGERCVFFGLYGQQCLTYQFRFMLLDLALSGALESARALHEFLLTYDVGCSYVKNLLARWDKYKLPPHLRDII